MNFTEVLRTPFVIEHLRCHCVRSNIQCVIDGSIFPHSGTFDTAIEATSSFIVLALNFKT